MLKLISVIFLLFSFANCLPSVSQPAQPQNTTRGESYDSKSIPSLSYCDLMKSRRRYTGKLVRLKASWQFGFERSSIYDGKCSGRPKSWLAFVEDKDACPASKANRNVPGKNDKEADVTVVGRLYGPARFGHMGAYDYKFEVVCMEEIKVTDSDITEK
ncbi:MAG: hypothetical protein WBV94_09580 [Blastocatellia bacterium]